MRYNDVLSSSSSLLLWLARCSWRLVALREGARESQKESCTSRTAGSPSLALSLGPRLSARNMERLILALWTAARDLDGREGGKEVEVRGPSDRDCEERKEGDGFEDKDCDTRSSAVFRRVERASRTHRERGSLWP